MGVILRQTAGSYFPKCAGSYFPFTSIGIDHDFKNQRIIQIAQEGHQGSP